MGTHQERAGDFVLGYAAEHGEKKMFPGKNETQGKEITRGSFNASSISSNVFAFLMATRTTDLLTQQCVQITKISFFVTLSSSP